MINRLSPRKCSETDTLFRSRMQPSFQPIALPVQPVGPGTRGIPPTAHTIVSGRIRPPYLFLLIHRPTSPAGELVYSAMLRYSTSAWHSTTQVPIFIDWHKGCSMLFPTAQIAGPVLRKENSYGVCVRPFDYRLGIRCVDRTVGRRPPAEYLARIATQPT